MSNLRLFCIGVVLAFGPALVWIVDMIPEKPTDAAATVFVALLLVIILTVLAGCVAIAAFGDRR